ncbi:hypothetical protein N9W34_04450 [Rickettsiales bacterium]|nr:hypothetical protein [Rickettsiales bacterium]
MKYHEFIEELTTKPSAFVAEGKKNPGELEQTLNDILSTGKITDLIPYYEQLIKAEPKDFTEDSLSVYLGALYTALYQNYVDSKKFGKDGPKPGEMPQDILKLRQHIAETFPRRRGEKVYSDILSVEEGAMGITKDEPIGTFLVECCVCMAIKDRTSENVALIHANTYSDLSSLPELLREKGINLNNSDIRITGGRHNKTKMSDSHMGLIEQAESNLAAVQELLEDSGGNIISADIIDSDSPRSFIVNPKTFELEKAFPARDNIMAQLRNMRKLGNKTEKRSVPIQCAFDLTGSQIRYEIDFNTKEKDFLMHYQTSFPEIEHAILKPDNKGEVDYTFISEIIFVETMFSRAHKEYKDITRVQNLDALDLSTTAPISSTLMKEAKDIGLKISTITPEIKENKQQEKSFVERMKSTTTKGSREI